MKNYQIKAFTLVELVIVAVILAILATVGFISYEDYLVDTRDSKRLSQLAGLRDSLRLQTTRGKLPLPDNSVEIRNNSTPFLYQWYAGKEVLETISYSENTMDPFDDVYYTYLLSRNRKDFQIMWFLEKYNKDVISFWSQKAHASVDYSQRYPNVFGKKLWILLQQETNTPLQEIPEYTSSGYIDLRDTTSNLFDAYVTDAYKISGKESDLIGIIPYTTCKKILETGWSYGNGIYNINPSGLNPFEVYCLMDTATYWFEGWWTLIARSIAWYTSASSFWWIYKAGDIRDDNVPYSMWSAVVDIPFSEIMYATYENGKTLKYADKIIVDSNFLKNNFNSQNLDSWATNYTSTQDTEYTQSISWCEVIYKPSSSWCGTYGSTFDPAQPVCSPCDNYRYKVAVWWKFGYPTWYVLPWRRDYENWLRAWWIHVWWWHPYNGEQWMIFVR